jgi:hypothetical protein
LTCGPYRNPRPFADRLGEPHNGCGGCRLSFGALVVWHYHTNHYRLVLALLIVAMFAAILHSYVFEDG